MKNEIIIYQTDELSEHIEVKIDEEKETVWLTQQQIAHLFGIQRPAITKHLGNIFKSGELDEKWYVPFWNIPLNTVLLKEKHKKSK